MAAAADRILDIYNLLKTEKVEVYLPGQHQGEVKTKYVVVTDQGANRFDNFSSTQCFVELLLYVPKEKYSELITFANTIKGYMKGLEPMIKPTYNESASFYDDIVKGHMISIEYQYYRKI